MALYPTRGSTKKISGNAASFFQKPNTYFAVDFGIDDTAGYKTLKYNLTVDYATIDSYVYRGSDGVIHNGTTPSGEIDISGYTSILLEGRFNTDSTNNWHRGYVYYELS